MYTLSVTKRQCLRAPRCQAEVYDMLYIFNLDVGEHFAHTEWCMIDIYLPMQVSRIPLSLRVDVYRLYVVAPNLLILFFFLFLPLDSSLMSF